MTAAEPVGPVVARKLKIKFSSKNLNASSGMNACESGHNVEKDFHSPVCGTWNPPERNAIKRRLSAKLEDGRPQKKQKMDPGVMHRCSSLLRSLINHPSGWVFKTPVDPVKLEIPDYFDIITNPMDLGTIKFKLDHNQYFATDEFAADVRLTFSNAMLYNPPSNKVHTVAVKLKEVFEKRWKALEEKWLHPEIEKAGDRDLIIAKSKDIGHTRQNSPKTPPLHNAMLPKRSNPSEGKVLRCSSYVRPAEVKLSKPAGNCNQKPVHQHLNKGTNDGGKHTRKFVHVKPSLNPVSKCCTCGKSSCQCILSSNSAHASSDISSERSSGRGHQAHSTDTSKVELQEKCMSVSQMSKSDPDSDGAVSALDEENVCPSSELMTPATDANSGEGWGPSIFDVQLSPTKALRAAMLKRRFADTILKAQHKTLLDQGDKADPVKLQQEKERLEKRQLEEKAVIEAQIRAAEAASRKKEEMELKKQREKEREAARLALENMEETAKIEQNIVIVKELEKLSGCSLSYSYSFGRKGADTVEGKIEGADSWIPLERLGLFIKDDVVDDEEELLSVGDEEEGEIFS
ncbi:transcription factor GTE12 [Mercurialis annua]|uniref:transcription factor GTE12 n=1 Tax=Mercurialis annua TaxID=3986 RepID=UPI00216010A7|nr:transcription factor GTE12 [Mercurialis annua]